MNKATTRKIMAIVAVIALVAILGVCLVACNKDDYVKRLKKAGYTADAGEPKDIGMSEEQAEELGIDWIVMGIKKGEGLSVETVSVVKFKKSADAKDFYEENKDKVLKGHKMERSGSIIISGTEQGVKDAK